jgi:hypothetical protein
MRRIGPTGARDYPVAPGPSLALPVWCCLILYISKYIDGASDSCTRGPLAEPGIGCLALCPGLGVLPVCSVSILKYRCWPGLLLGGTIVRGYRGFSGFVAWRVRGGA